MSFAAIAAGAGWGLAGGLTIALVLAIWMIQSLIGLLRKASDYGPNGEQSTDVVPLQRRG